MRIDSPRCTTLPFIFMDTEKFEAQYKKDEVLDTSSFYIVLKTSFFNL